jgi:hypothetical protein
MQLKEVKVRFESGNLKAAFISEAVFEKGYNLNIQEKNSQTLSCWQTSAARAGLETSRLSILRQRLLEA